MAARFATWGNGTKVFFTSNERNIFQLFFIQIFRQVLEESHTVDTTVHIVLVFFLLGVWQRLLVKRHFNKIIAVLNLIVFGSEIHHS